MEKIKKSSLKEGNYPPKKLCYIRREKRKLKFYRFLKLTKDDMDGLTENVKEFNVTFFIVNSIEIII
jgi:hypothetical protein